MQAGRDSSLDLVEQSLERVQALDTGLARLGVMMAINPTARDDAIDADRHLWRTGKLLGPLHGIPVLVKDTFETQGLVTTFGCRAFASYVPFRDADAVTRLREAGAIILGKTSTPDLALSWLSESSTGVSAVNSRSRLHEAGGSSSGSAVGVAAGLAPVAIGSDTGGSVRIPASFNGLVAMRPTTGRISTRGMSTLVCGQDTVGPIATCVADARLMMCALLGRPWRADHLDRALDSFRLGVLRLPDTSEGWDGADLVSDQMNASLSVLEEAGFTCEDVVVPGLNTLMRDSSLYMSSARTDIDTFLGLRPELGFRTFAELHRDGVFPERLDLAHLLATRPPADPDSHAGRLAGRARLRATIAYAIYSRRLDALVYPSVQVPPPLRERDHERLPGIRLPTNTLVAAQADLPALTLPAGTTPDGLPAGLELMGGPGMDAALLRLGAVVEQLLSGG
jgi:Asp-tRNA(Asn)/Glu-tRNA(Gln) amidotransferase A subunit family amidase